MGTIHIKKNVVYKVSQLEKDSQKEIPAMVMMRNSMLVTTITLIPETPLS